MENQTILSRPRARPQITFLIKGLMNSGKSTLFNAIFSNNISKTSTKRQTMCQVVVTEGQVKGIARDVKDVFREIQEINTEVYAKVSIPMYLN